MAKYSLSAIKRNGEYWPINWNNLPENQNVNPNSLVAIDDFTTKFKDEDELKKYLLERANEVFLDENQWQYPYALTYIYDKKMHKLIHGIAYSGDKKFLDEMYILTYLRRAIVLPDKDIINRICNAYRNHPIQSENIYALREYLLLLSNGGSIEIKYPTAAIINLFYREVYQYDRSTGKYKEGPNGETVINYRGLRDLGMLLAKYDRTKIKKPEIKIEERIKQLEEKEASKKGNAYSLGYEQTSMFDLLKNN